MKCNICGKSIIGSTMSICMVCSQGISPEAIKKANEEKIAEEKRLADIAEKEAQALIDSLPKEEPIITATADQGEL